TTAPSASTSKSSSFHSPDGRDADARLRISEDMTRKWAIRFPSIVPPTGTLWRDQMRAVSGNGARTHPTAHARLGQRQSYMLHRYQPNMDLCSLETITPVPARPN